MIKSRLHIGMWLVHRPPSQHKVVSCVVAQTSSSHLEQNESHFLRTGKWREGGRVICKYSDLNISPAIFSLRELLEAMDSPILYVRNPSHRTLPPIL